MTLEEQVKELEVKLQATDVSFMSMKAALSDKDAVIAGLQKANAEVADRNKELDKEFTILKAQQKAATESRQAADIMDGILKDSVVSESLQPKLKAMVNYDNFRTESGDFNAATFAEAFKAEVKDWEDKLPKSTSVGLVDAQVNAPETKRAKYSDENAKILAEIRR